MPWAHVLWPGTELENWPSGALGQEAKQQPRGRAGGGGCVQWALWMDAHKSCQYVGPKEITRGKKTRRGGQKGRPGRLCVHVIYILCRCGGGVVHGSRPP